MIFFRLLINYVNIKSKSNNDKQKMSLKFDRKDNNFRHLT